MNPNDFKRIHLIATGGSIMHNLALALAEKGLQVSGSDDEIFEPAKSRLAAAGLLPEKDGWFPEKITSELDAVIIGMHARADNPELLKAQELNIPIYSFPEAGVPRRAGNESAALSRRAAQCPGPIRQGDRKSVV